MSVPVRTGVLSASSCELSAAGFAAGVAASVAEDDSAGAASGAL